MKMLLSPEEALLPPKTLAEQGRVLSLVPLWLTGPLPRVTGSPMSTLQSKQIPSVGAEHTTAGLLLPGTKEHLQEPIFKILTEKGHHPKMGKGQGQNGYLKKKKKTLDTIRTNQQNLQRGQSQRDRLGNTCAQSCPATKGLLL